MGKTGLEQETHALAPLSSLRAAPEVGTLGEVIYWQPQYTRPTGDLQGAVDGRRGQGMKLSKAESNISLIPEELRRVNGPEGGPTLRPCTGAGLLSQ